MVSVVQNVWYLRVVFKGASEKCFKREPGLKITGSVSLK